MELPATQTPARSLIREAWDRTRKFVLPEETMSLKLVFDNVRNYIVCAAVVAAVVALTTPQSGNALWPWTLTTFAVLLIGTNALQSWFIIERITGRIGRFQHEVRPRWGKFQRRLLRLFLIAAFIPIMAAGFQGFSILIIWAIKGGK